MESAIVRDEYQCLICHRPLETDDGLCFQCIEDQTEMAMDEGLI